ncbi:hypothetical protein DQ384_27380 [Sphaerisporangium album]|uniref:Uncharacterized protein n=1 Tax=Sphaerisporangium album TaxID=509200 RepID=A0A367FBE3_9ACTN|nr:hypothetical protein [Sphaerisporangium album]RCG27007.1 hypothetical protein DQ384_27380 [Sphaerisporangium album]
MSADADTSAEPKDTAAREGGPVHGDGATEDGMDDVIDMGTSAGGAAPAAADSEHTGHTTGDAGTQDAGPDRQESGRSFLLGLAWWP